MISNPRRVYQFTTAEFAHSTADYLQVQVRFAIQQYGECRIVLAGGRTPAEVYRALSTKREVDWSKVHVFVGDERCVSPDHADSNYRMLAENLLSRVSVPARQIHRLRGEIEPSEAATAYDALIASLDEPKFHVVLNGIGADGHTASLFPGDQTIVSERAWAVTARAPAQFAVEQRLTLTMRALNSTKLSITFCTGADKRTVRDMILALPDGSPLLPASLLRGLDQSWWFVDDA